MIAFTNVTQMPKQDNSLSQCQANNETEFNRLISNRASKRATISTETPVKTILGIPITVWQIGLMMFLMNLSYVIAYSFSGLYIKNILGATALSIGILEGLCETVSYLMKLCSGVISDWMGKRKAIMIFGYSFSVVSKIMLGLSSTFGLVFTAKVFERFGNGMQASPRDAIVADIAPHGKIGASYGLKRSLAHTGSVLGGLSGILAMKLTNGNFQHVFMIAACPAVIAFIILVFFLKEPKKLKNQDSSTQNTTEQTNQTKDVKFSLKNIKYLGKTFWSIILINIIFMLSRMDEQFLILNYNENFVHDVFLAPTVMIIMNIGALSASYPCGRIGDKMNRAKLLLIGVFVLVMSDLLMYTASSTFMMYCGILLWGVQTGVSQNVFYSLIAENVISSLRGTALGIYWLTNAFAVFLANFIAGHVAHWFNYRTVFLSSGIVATITIFALIWVISKDRIAKKM